MPEPAPIAAPFTLGTGALAHWAARTPHKPAALFPGSGAVLTYAALDRRAAQAAQWLAGPPPTGLGLEPGACIALLLDNCAEVFELAFAAERAGLYYVPVSTHLRAAEIAHILADCAARVVVTKPEFLPHVPGRPGLVVAVVGAGYEAMVGGQPGTKLPPRPIGRDLMYSSGTTGSPKGVFRPLAPANERGAAAPVPGVLAAAGVHEPDTVYLSTGPLYHAAPHRFTMHVLHCGGTCIVPRRFDAAAALALIAQHRVTHSQWVPTMFVRLLALPPELRESHDLGSHRRAIHAAAPCPVAVKEAMIAWWGPILFEYYAGSETVGATGIESADWLAHKGSVGRAISGTLHITGEHGAPLPPGEVGLVRFSGQPRFEYLNAPDKTAAAYDAQGRGTYGDLGHVDGEGYLYLSDRRADLIVTGGVNVYPQEVEQVLALHPDVADVGVVGVPDAELGERVQAVVVLRPGASIGVEALIAFCRERLSGIKAPRGVELVEALPRSDVGKLLRRVLKERYRSTR